ncbi:hypothetical protein [Herbiconiux sp. A18JL235]|uniref:DUF3592 domain-containing protein n=1 Tax=Herbiconiux sp. A18JL235 TaxID=3152363 RepID=A0AB39BED3_9MICO
MTKPPAAWPVWLVFGLFIIPGLIGLGLLGGAKDSAHERVAFTEDAAGRSVVVTGRLSDVETNPGLPQATAYYSAEIPDARGGSATTVSLAGDEHWGFPPSSDFPKELDFLIVLDDPPRGVAHGPVGSLHEVSDADVATAQSDFAVAQGLWIGGIVVFWVLLLGLPALAISFTLRRRRAARAAAPPPIGSTPRI